MSGSGICAIRKNQSRSRAATRDGGARLGRLRVQPGGPALPFSLARLLIGRPIANEDAEDTKLGVIAGVPAMGLDGLGSSAYGPEAALTILIAARRGRASRSIGPITAAILVLLAILVRVLSADDRRLSQQRRLLHRSRKENLGTRRGLLAAAALMIDYMLNVAVGISAGVGALTSADARAAALHAGALPRASWRCVTRGRICAARAKAGLALRACRPTSSSRASRRHRCSGPGRAIRQRRPSRRR